MLFVSPAALEDALPKLSRDAVFTEVLAMRYLAPDAATNEFDVAKPTVEGGGLMPAVRALAGLHATACDPTAADWRLDKCYQAADKERLFFPLGTGAGTRNKRWKYNGGQNYAQSGLHTRFSPTISPSLKNVIQAYSEAQWQVPGQDGEDEDVEGRHVVFDAGYAQAAFDDVLEGRPISLWDMAAWLFRFVPIPSDDRNLAMQWIRQQFERQLRLPPALIAPREDLARQAKAWFFDEPQPDPAIYFAAARMSDDKLLQICRAFDQKWAKPSASSGATSSGEAAPGESSASAIDALLDDGAGGQLLVDEAVVASIILNLQLGKHLLLIGPPGTGKSTLAKNAAEVAKAGLLSVPSKPAGWTFTTATATWTAFDTVGGYVPARSGAGLTFRPGIFLRAFGANCWVVVDELNRADVDKAFGPMLTILSGLHADVDLPFEVEVEPTEKADATEVSTVKVLHEQNPAAADLKRYRYKVPPSWRMLATMNTYDKNSLFRLSYALLRRFAVVYVDALDTDDTLALVDAKATLAVADRGRLAALLDIASKVGRPLGPATALDVARFVRAARPSGAPSTTSPVESEPEADAGASPSVEAGDGTPVSSPGSSPAGEASGTGEPTASATATSAGALVGDPFLQALAAYVLPQLDGIEPGSLREVRKHLVEKVVAPGAATELGRIFEQMLELPA